LLSLVPRLYDPDAGMLLIDGQNVRDFSVRSLRRQIGVVTQETVMFSGTIRQNISYGSTEASEAEILDAARKSRALEFIERLPLGLDTPVAEQGLSLSGGQRQRLAIARAILRNPAILILDEATSMIDAESEHLIGEAITDFTKGRTCLIVAHRLSTVVQADRIVVMEQGKIVDIGRHTDLLSRCSVYQRLVRTQLVGSELATA
jgi:subfamily B ATP-binding cassette protein MsbA